MNRVVNRFENIMDFYYKETHNIFKTILQVELEGKDYRYKIFYDSYHLKITNKSKNILYSGRHF